MKSIRSYNIILCFICSFLLIKTTTVKAQAISEVEAKNLYIEFLNESVHGLFTAHALLVINNKEVNKYIDLESYSLNNLTNSEVQSNLFKKSDKANYTTYQGYSPMQLLQLAKENSKVLEPALAARLNSRVDRIGVILNKINQLRYDISDFIDTHDLNQKESIYGVFEILEECSKLFRDYEKEHNAIVREIGNTHDSANKELYLSALRFHSINKSILQTLRNEKSSAVLDSRKDLLQAFNNFEEQLSNYFDYDKRAYRSYVKARMDSIGTQLNKFANSNFVPKAYRIYGKYYYYHNQIAKRFMNWSGPGYVRYLNRLMSELGVKGIEFSEEPLIFEVVYPMKLDELNDLTKEERYISSRNLDVSLPEMKASPRKERPDSNYVTIGLRDFNMLDRDSIKLMVDGKILLDNYELKGEEETINIVIENAEIKIAVEALNMGIISPNTPEISIRFKDERKKHRVEAKLLKGEQRRFILKSASL